MSVSQTLTVTEVAGSASVTSNTSRVKIRWTSTQSGDSWNGNTKTAYYYVSINGGAETSYAVSYTLPKGTTKTILDTTITVAHKDDGTGSVSVRTWMDTGISIGVVEKSQNLTLTTIARASTIESAGNVTLGNACSIKWTPKSSSFRYKLEFSLGSWRYTTDAIHPNKTSAYTYTGYTVPLDVADNVPSDTGTMTVNLYTYSDSAATKQVGSADAETFTVTVPDNPNTKPAMPVMGLVAVNGDLGERFSGLYIQGKSKVKWASGTATGKYGATIRSYSMSVGGVNYDKRVDYTSNYLASYGTVKVTGYATDSRGYTGSTEQDINVIPYGKPKAAVEVCGRCDEYGNLADNGTYLKIKATRIYSIVSVNGEQKNFCKIQYRYKATDAEKYSNWITILEGQDLSGDQVETEALLSGSLAVDKSYLVQVQAIDDIGENSGEIPISIATDKVYMHRTKNAMGLGKYAEGENLLDVGWDANFHGAVQIGGQAIVNHVVEEGTSGIWKYRKWADGTAECWGTSEPVTVTINAAWGSMYAVDDAIPSYTFPFAFTSAPLLFVTLKRISGGSCWMYPGEASTTATETAAICLVRPTVANVTAAVDYHAIGRWKE